MVGIVGTNVIKDGNGAAIVGGVRMFDISGTAVGPWVPMSVPCDLTGAAIDLSLPAEIVGSVSAGSADSGKPLKIGAVNNTTLPAYTNGQRGDAQLDTRGGIYVVLKGANGTVSPVVGTPGDGASVQQALFTNSYQAIWNGASYDRQRKPNAVSRIPSAAASVNATSAKASAGDLWKANGYNAKAAVVYLKVYAKATAPTVGTDTPVLTVAIPASSAFDFDFNGLYIATGIAYGFTTDAADNGTTALLAGDILGFSLIYA